MESSLSEMAEMDPRLCLSIDSGKSFLLRNFGEGRGNPVEKCGPGRAGDSQCKPYGVMFHVEHARLGTVNMGSMFHVEHPTSDLRYSRDPR